mgnify:CR=1 FL=1
MEFAGCCGQPGVWRLIENRTSFERSARQRTPDMAVVWLPGFPPGWWQESMRHLLAATLLELSEKAEQEAYL